MVVKSILVVESAAVSGQAPLVRNDEGGPGSGRRPGLKHGIPKELKRMAKRSDKELAGIGASPRDRFASLNMYAKALAQHAMRRAFPQAEEVTPPGYEKIVRGLKKSGRVTNPWAVAWWMKDKGIKPKTSEAAPVASGVCHDEETEACQCPDCKKVENGVPSQLLHDETPKVPVKSFRDDIVRKTKLRKVMGKKPDPDEGPVHASEAVPSSFNDDPAGMDDSSDLDLGMLDPDDNEEIPSGDDQMWTKEEVNYRYSGDKFESCGNCVHFKFPGSCNIIAGPVRSVDVCDKFEADDEDKGTDFGWQQQQPQPESEDEDAHSVTDQTVPSTLVPLKDKNAVQAKLVGATADNGTSGFGKSYGMVGKESPASAWGMVTKNDEGGPGSGRVPGVHVNGIQNFPGKEPHVVFTDKITKSTMLLPQSQATPENMQAKAVAKRREFYGDPTERRQAMKKTASESEAIMSLANRLAESAFDQLKGKLARKKGVTSPGGLAAYIGRKKYGKAGMSKKAAAGRRKTTEAPGEFMPVGPGKTAGDASGKMTYEPTQRNKKFKGVRDSGKKVAPQESKRPFVARHRTKETWSDAARAAAAARAKGWQADHQSGKAGAGTATLHMTHPSAPGHDLSIDAQSGHWSHAVVGGSSFRGGKSLGALQQHLDAFHGK